MKTRKSPYKVLWFPYAQRGALYPIMPAIEALIKTGADVLALGPASLRAFAKSHGIKFVPYQSTPDYNWSNSNQFDPRSLGPVNGRDQFLQLTEAEFIDAAAAITRFKPDVVLADSFFVGGALAAERFDIPWATYVHYMFDERATTDNMYRVWWEQSDRDELDTYIQWWTSLRNRLGLNPDLRSKDEAPWYRMSPHLTLLLTHPELRRTGRPLPAYVTRVHLPPWNETSTGSTPVAWPAVTCAQPRVMVSNSSAWQADFDLIQTTITGLREANVEVVVTIAAEHEYQMEFPGNATVLGYCPHADLIPHVDTVVTTAGAGVVGKALWFGKPIIAVPFARDQHFVAETIVDCGLGLSIKRPLTSASIVAAVSEVISSYEIKTRVRCIAGPRPGYPGAAEVCQLVLRLCDHRT